MKKYAVISAMLTLFISGFYVFYIRKNNELKKQIGSMLIIGFAEERINSSTNKSLKNAIKNQEIGGVILLTRNEDGSSRNFTNEAQLKALIGDIKSLSTEALITIDVEGGVVNRLRNIRDFGSMQSAVNLAKISAEDIQESVAHYSKEMKDLGIDWNYAPVVDLALNNGSIAVSNGRAASDEPEIVAVYAKNFIIGANSAGIITSLKHFPGHGSGAGDTHKELVDLTEKWSEKELTPYKELIQQDMANSVMLSHVIIKQLDEERPASLSYNIITKLLREKMNYDGVIITDSIDMKALSNHYTLEEIVIKSINAGADIILNANYFNYDKNLHTKMFNIIYNAVKEGKIERYRINESHQRITKMRLKIKNKILYSSSI